MDSSGDSVEVVGVASYRTVMDDERAKALISDADRVILMTNAMADPKRKTAAMILDTANGTIGVVYIHSEVDGGWLGIEIKVDMAWLKQHPESEEAGFVRRKIKHVHDTILSVTSNVTVTNILPKEECG